MYGRNPSALLSLLGALAVAVPAVAQQVADPDFDVRVDDPAYANAGPRILFDNAHFNFHTSTGRYQPFVDLVTSDGYLATPNADAFSEPTLRDYDILVIANAQDSAGHDVSAFSRDEVSAVERWVREGGALLLIADHQPWGAAAAPLARRFGVDMGSVFTIDSIGYYRELGHHFGQAGMGILTFVEPGGLGCDHPILNGRNDEEKVRRIITFAGQSLGAPPEAVVLLRLADTATDIHRTGEMSSAAGRAQGVAVRFGKGRVVVLGEAAMLTAQLVGPERMKIGMNTPGFDNRQFALNVMHWLSGLLT